MRTLLSCCLSLAVVISIASCAEHKNARKEREIDAATFRQTLQCGAQPAGSQPNCETFRSEAKRIESVNVEPRGQNSARYVITWRDRGTRDVVYAEYPGKITDEMTAAGIMYSVK